MLMQIKSSLDLKIVATWFSLLDVYDVSTNIWTVSRPCIFDNIIDIKLTELIVDFTANTYAMLHVID